MLQRLNKSKSNLLQQRINSTKCYGHEVLIFDELLQLAALVKVVDAEKIIATLGDI